MQAILTAELSSEALHHNTAQVRGAIGGGVKLCAVVKADAYGHGLSELLPAFVGKVDCLAVTTASTALRVRELGWAGPVLVFFRAAGLAHGKALGEALTALRREGVTLTVTGEEDRSILTQLASRKGERSKDFQVHLKVDSGMSRSGVLCRAAEEEILRWRDIPGVRLRGIFTQIASADSADLTSAREQLRSFSEVTSVCGDLVVHAANSATTVALPEAHFDMVRPGLLLYGAYPSADIARPLDLRPVMRLTARLLEVKTVPAGSRCGYGLTHRFEEETRIGLVPVGYADGYPRSLSGLGRMRVRDRWVPVRGRVSMDQVVVDLSTVPGAEVGDEVEIIGRESQAENGVETLAALARTIPYEIYCGLGSRVQRLLVAD